ncbi:hypothetical protein [Halonotius pteroides]|uniref:Uncharacterized protein n=1 Tax=Halonotius pteroides TaxID=268735 RepID=A0A3A6QCZ4_9EURY|nr:hypothetical protein [Halonotius pteroides]RJX51082.1 hypothetical protein DP106_03070 [Halonotius pteroides]
MSSEAGGAETDADDPVHQSDAPDATATQLDPAEATDREEVDRHGWVLVAGVVACFLVVPGLIYLRPAIPAAAGLPFFATFLILPLVPAVLLGLLAVWSMRAAA